MVQYEINYLPSACQTQDGVFTEVFLRGTDDILISDGIETRKDSLALCRRTQL